MLEWLRQDWEAAKIELRDELKAEMERFPIGWLVRRFKASRDQAARRKAAIARGIVLRQQIDARFGKRLYIVPDEIFADKKISRNDVWYDENRADYWQRMLDEFPNAPCTQREVTRNEARFWEIWVETFTVEGEDGESDLEPHARIDVFYRSAEKWVLRFYFAATGKVIDPWIREFVDLQLAYRRIEKWSYDNPHKSGARSEVHRDMMHCLGKGHEAHFEKWGEWFVSHVAETFRQKHLRPPERRQQLADGGWASLTDIQGAAEPEWLMPDLSPMQDAQSQQFED